jgi:hypothetical protein
MSERILVWKVTPIYERFGCTDCEWRPTEPQSRIVAELEFARHICAKYPRQARRAETTLATQQSLGQVIRAQN